MSHKCFRGVDVFRSGFEPHAAVLARLCAPLEGREKWFMQDRERVISGPTCFSARKVQSTSREVDFGEARLGQRHLNTRGGKGVVLEAGGRKVR